MHKIKNIKLIDEVHVYMRLHFASTKSTAGNKTRSFPSPFLISMSWFTILVEVFRSDHVAACRTALRSATEKNEMDGYVTVACSIKMTERSSTADWLKFTRLVTTEHMRNKYSLLESSSVIIVVITTANSLTLSILI